MAKHTSADTRAVLLRNPNFLWVMSGALLSMLGDQFTLIALPWMVLKMTGDTLALGIVLALIGIPRALFMLIGGALVDRYSPKQVLMLSKYVNTFLLGLLGLLVLSGNLSQWMLYGLALAIGLTSAFSIPSATSMMPNVVPPEQLQAANSMMLGLRQFTMFAGPVLAGLLIAVFADGRPGFAGVALGIGCAFLFDAFSFALSAWTLSHVVLKNGMPAAGEPVKKQHVLHDVAESLRFCWNDRGLRTCFLYWGAIMFFITGPVQVAMPVLATTLGDSAAGFGFLAGSHAAGTLLGMVVSGIKPNLRFGSLGATMLLIDCTVGALFIPMGFIGATWQGVVILLAIGMLGGFLQVGVFTWIQQRVPRAMLGRTMGIFMFIFVGIAPLSSALTGWLMRSITPAQLFAGSGSFLIVIVLIALATTPMRTLLDVRASP